MNVLPIADHPRQEDLAAYVSDTLDPEQAEALEAHVFECALCAQRLADEAELQNLMHEVAAQIELEAEPVRISAPRRLARRIGMAGGIWAAAAVVALMVWPKGDVEPGARSTDAASMVSAASDEGRWSSECDPGDPDCGGTLLASLDPLESVDPLSSWPGDPLVDTRSIEDFSDGEPCGSGEDGGALVCPTRSEPISG
ncbi:MAG: zf-HC2 domain-containing protein [Myxococcota bacterium]